MPDRPSLQQAIRGDEGCITRDDLDPTIGLRRHPDGMGSVYAQVNKDRIADVVPGTVLILTYAIVRAIDYETGVISLDVPDLELIDQLKQASDKDPHG